MQKTDYVHWKKRALDLAAFVVLVTIMLHTPVFDWLGEFRFYHDDKRLKINRFDEIKLGMNIQQIETIIGRAADEFNREQATWADYEYIVNIKLNTEGKAWSKELNFLYPECPICRVTKRIGYKCFFCGY